MLNNFELYEDSKKRELYVAMTRAKNNLIIHLNNNILDGINIENLIIKTDSNQYNSQESIVLQTTHRDVWLDSFINDYKQKRIRQLQSGDKVFYSKGTCINEGKKELFRFSKAFISKIEEQQQKDYLVEEVRINFMVYWKKEDTEQETLIILPEIYLKEKHDATTFYDYY